MLLDSLSGSRVLAAVAILMTNVGSKYLSLELDASHEKVLQDPLVRRVVLFCVLFLATRDIMVSLMVLGVILVLLEITRSHPKTKKTD